jgi:hypothetical protein
MTYEFAVLNARQWRCIKQELPPHECLGNLLQAATIIRCCRGSRPFAGVLHSDGRFASKFGRSCCSYCSQVESPLRRDTTLRTRKTGISNVNAWGERSSSCGPSAARCWMRRYRTDPNQDRFRSCQRLDSDDPSVEIARLAQGIAGKIIHDRSGRSGLVATPVGSTLSREWLGFL